MKDKTEHEVQCEVILEVRRMVTIQVPAVSVAVAKMYAQDAARRTFAATANRVLPGETLKVRKVRVSL